MNARDENLKITAIVNARIYCVDEGFRSIANGTVVFNEAEILALGESSEVDVPESAEVIDGKGRLAVLPGLIDAHSHSSLLKGFSENAQLMDWLPEYQREHQVLNEEDAYFSCLVNYMEALKGGTTTVLDMYRFLHKGAQAATDLGLRVHLVPYAADHPTKHFFETLESSEQLVRDYHNAENGRIKVWMGMEHITYCSEAFYKRALDIAERYSVNIHTHTSEQKEEVIAVEEGWGDRPIAIFADWGILKPGTVLAHCVWLDDREIKILSDTGTGVSHCPISNMKLASGAAPIEKLWQANIPLGLGSDGGVCNNSVSMWECMKTASLLQKVTHLDATAVSAEQALRMATIDGAKLLGVAEQIGSIELGKRADIITVDLWQPHLLPIIDSEGHDPVLWNLVFAARASDVLDVWVDGRRVVANKSLVRIDEMEALQAIHAQTKDILQRRERAQAIPMIS